MYKNCTYLLEFDENCAHIAHFVNSRLMGQTWAYKKKYIYVIISKGNMPAHGECSRHGIAIAILSESYDCFPSSDAQMLIGKTKRNKRHRKILKKLCSDKTTQCYGCIERLKA
jgi:hypothetical protein